MGFCNVCLTQHGLASIRPDSVKGPSKNCTYAAADTVTKRQCRPVLVYRTASCLKFTPTASCTRRTLSPAGIARPDTAEVARITCEPYTCRLSVLHAAWAGEAEAAASSSFDLEDHFEVQHLRSVVCCGGSVQSPQDCLLYAGR